jgi:DNA-binding NarL/FixJ family response regulator
MKVMVIDDDATTLQVLEAVLERLGHDVVLRSEALGTMRAVASEQPEVVVLDVSMPGLNGDRLAALLQEKHPSLRLVLHSSLPGNELDRLARSCGAAGYIEKSGDPTHFAETFRRLVPARPSADPKPRRPGSGG